MDYAIVAVLRQNSVLNHATLSVEPAAGRLIRSPTPAVASSARRRLAAAVASLLGRTVAKSDANDDAPVIAAVVVK
jgi:hypothetical protein